MKLCTAWRSYDWLDFCRCVSPAVPIPIRNSYNIMYISMYCIAFIAVNFDLKSSLLPLFIMKPCTIRRSSDRRDICRWVLSCCAYQFETSQFVRQNMFISIYCYSLVSVISTWNPSFSTFRYEAVHDMELWRSTWRLSLSFVFLRLPARNLTIR